MNGPDRYPAVARAMAEKQELLRRAALAAIARADAGQPVDQDHIAWARSFVKFNAPLQGPLGTGTPACDNSSVAHRARNQESM